MTETGKLLKLTMQLQSRDTCQWLRINELGQSSLSSNIVYTDPLMAELEGELSIATLRFCEQHYPKSEWLKRKRISSAEHICYFCEVSRVKSKLYPLLLWVEGLTSEPPENIGQRRAVEQARRVQQNHRAILEGNDEVIPHPFPPVKKIMKDGMHLIEQIKDDAHRIIATNNDYELQSHFEKYLDAETHYWTKIDRSEELGIVVLDDLGNFTLSEKNKKTSKSKDFKPKRGHGRPPKKG